MAVSTTQHLDVSQVIATLLADVEGLRVEYYVSDKSRPPVAVVALPTVTWNDPDAGFCWGTFDVPITIITARNNDLDAQRELSRFVRDVATALDHTPVEGIYDIALLDARPTIASINGQELPAYIVRVQVRA